MLLDCPIRTKIMPILTWVIVWIIRIDHGAIEVPTSIFLNFWNKSTAPPPAAAAAAAAIPKMPMAGYCEWYLQMLIPSRQPKKKVKVATFPMSATQRMFYPTVLFH